MKKLTWLILLAAITAIAQETQTGQQMDQHQHAGHDMAGMNAQHDQMHGMEEPANYAEQMDLGFGSGTAWQAISGPEYMWMWRKGGWDLMLHGELFLTFNYQGGPRGEGKAESENWLMGMQQRKLWHGMLQFRQMLSAEPLTAPHPGFPELFQTGEEYHGTALVDYQHPHDVFGELSVKYILPIGESFGWEFYGGPAAEPALGPVAFLHRNSATENATAPLGHHLQDSTHISFGVVTTGISYKKFKLEGSLFNGREPDDKRYDFDFAPMDSYSGRINFSPNKNWAMQYSAARLIHPEAPEPDDVVRQTASVNYNRAMKEGNWATTLIWGRNHKTLAQTNQNSYLLESQVNFAKKNYAYTRLELVDKDELFPEGGGPPRYDSFRIGAYSFGAVRDFLQTEHWQIGLGGDVTFYSKPAVLVPYYGDNPIGLHVLLRIRPGKMNMHMH